jgi:hypothetical protein
MDCPENKVYQCRIITAIMIDNKISWFVTSFLSVLIVRKNIGIVPRQIEINSQSLVILIQGSSTRRYVLCCPRLHFCNIVLLHTITNIYRLNKISNSELIKITTTISSYGLGPEACSSSELLLKLWISIDSLDEWSASSQASAYTGQHNTDRRGQTPMPWTGFEPTIQYPGR